jgi:hypothetical protein
MQRLLRPVLFALIYGLLAFPVTEVAAQAVAEGPPVKTASGKAEGCAPPGTAGTPCLGTGTVSPDPNAAGADGGVGSYEGNFGAIAVGNSLSWGSAWNRDTRDQARRDAVGACDHTGCRAVTWVKDGCAALATGYDGWGAAWDDNARGADVDALEACSGVTGGCEVATSFCTGNY